MAPDLAKIIVADNSTAFALSRQTNRIYFLNS
jgi:hypothetical protein